VGADTSLLLETVPCTHGVASDFQPF